MKVGDRVTLKANPEEGWTEERGILLEDEGHGMWIVEVDKEFCAGNVFDDGIREVTEDQIEVAP